MTQHAGSEQLIWERAEPVTPAGRPAADAGHIARAAFEIADREGIDAVSIKRVAGRLKVQATALAGYLGGREDLLDLMLDRAFGELHLPAPSGDWRHDLRAVAQATQQVALQHPWLRVLAGTRTPSGPNGLRVNEQILAAFDGTGLPPVRTTQLANAVLAFVYGFVQLDTGAAHRSRDERAEAAHRERTSSYLHEAVGSGNYPHLAGLFADADGLTAQAAFEAGLDVVLDGVAAQLAQAQSVQAQSVQAQSVQAQPVPAPEAAGQPAAQLQTEVPPSEFSAPEPVRVPAFARLRRARNAPKPA
jgi:AcrR family transcriptional regulator